MEDDTIGAFNAMIEPQKSLDGKVFVSTVLFANTSSVLNDKININKIEPINRNQYQLSGGTALLDAIGGAIHHIGNVHKYLFTHRQTVCRCLILWQCKRSLNYVGDYHD